LAADWIALFALIFFIGYIWIPNMIKKDKSLSRYPEFDDYSKKSKRFIPFIY